MLHAGPPHPCIVAPGGTIWRVLHGICQRVDDARDRSGTRYRKDVLGIAARAACRHACMARMLMHAVAPRSGGQVHTAARKLVD